jgi:hypothetical protein
VEITETDFEGLRQRLLRDIAQGQFQHVRVTEPHYREAERLIVAYSASSLPILGKGE